MGEGEEGDARVKALQARGNALKVELATIPAERLPPPCRARLLKLVRGELNFLGGLGSRVSSTDALASSNFGHLEAIAQVLQHPLVTGICGVMQQFSVEKSSVTEETPMGSYVHVDLVGLYDGKPAWLVVSDRNPKNNPWTEGDCQKGLKFKILLLLQAALANVVIRPASIVFFFAKGIEANVGKELEAEFNACKIEVDEHPVSEVEAGEWLLVEGEENDEPMSNSWISLPVKSNSLAVMYRIDLPTPSVFEDGSIYLNLCAESTSKATTQEFIGPGLVDSMFYVILADMNRRWGHAALERTDEPKLVNLDTTALIGIVSGISNNGASYIATCTAKQLKKMFNSFGHFFKTQALLELKEPFLPEMATIFKQKQPMISRFAWEEFQSIVSVVGGPDEKRRASALHECMKPFILPDMPSERVMALPRTGKIQERHKIVFGTGDSMHAPTLTSNVSFLRAATAKGMALASIEHRPLALTRD